MVIVLHREKEMERSRAWLTCLLPANERDDHAAGEISCCISFGEKQVPYTVSLSQRTRVALEKA